MTKQSKKTIFITGASRGFGKLWANEFLKRGDNVIATARNIEPLQELKSNYSNTLMIIQLDVNDRTMCINALKQAYNHFGRIDVLINNAGFGVFGAIEEASEKDVRNQFDTNFFGSLWISQAVIPMMRNQGHGHIIQVSSVLGVASVPLLGIYNASKWAVEGFIESMSTEIKAFGIHTTLIEPIAYDTDFSGKSGVNSVEIPAYNDLRLEVYAQRQYMPVGRPEATINAIFKIVDTDKPPLRIFFGSSALPWVKQVYDDRVKTWEEWNELAIDAEN
jgi:short-subunit dehydrogenase